MGILDVLIDIMRSRGAPMTAPEIYKAVIAYSPDFRRRFAGKDDYIENYIRRRCPGVEITYSVPDKQFRLVEGDRYTLLDTTVLEEPSPLPTDPHVRQPGPVFGAPLNFRGLRHAPINEMGVVYIFGMVSYELGFIVEALQSSFPDCEAKRCIAKDRWQRVRIEFEFRSRNYVAHKHPLEGADLIVCWEHDWSDCPLEVLELKSALASLKG